MSIRLVFVLFCLGMSMGRLAQATGPAPDPLTPAERAWLAAHPRIVLGAGEDWAPSVVKDAQGNVSGFAVDHLALLNRRLGTDIRIEAGPWHKVVAKAEAGEIDGLMLTAPLDERRARFDFTDPYFTVHDFVFLRTADAAARAAPAGLHELRGKRVGYLNGTLRISRVLAQHPRLTAVPADSYADLARMLLLGEIDAAIASYSLEYWRASNGALGIVPTTVVRDTEARMVMTIRKDRGELVGILNKGLAALDRDAVEPLYRKWFGADYLNRIATFDLVLTPEERAWLARHPVLRVGIDPTWAPVEYVDANGVARGMSLAYLERIGRMLDTRIELVPDLSWADAMARLGDRALDVLPAIAATPERREKIAFTEPYLSFPAAIFSAAGVAYLGGPESLKGRRVAVARGEAVVDWLRDEWPDLELVLVGDTREGLRKVADGDAFAFIGNLVTTSHLMTTTILIADDHRLFRQGLVALLREQRGWEVVGEADDGAEAIRLAQALQPQVAVIDVEMPNVGGVEAARGIRRVARDTRIVALSMYSDAHYRERMRHAGASAYVLKNEAIDDLVSAIHAVLRGEVWQDHAVSQESAVAVRSAQLDREALSEREREVLRLLAQGLRTGEFPRPPCPTFRMPGRTVFWETSGMGAKTLHLSPKTVETYRSRLMNKLGIDNLSGRVRFAVRAGLVSPESRCSDRSREARRMRHGNPRALSGNS